MIDDVTVTVGDAGEAIAEIGTDDGIAVHEITTKLGDPGTVI